MRTWFHDSSQAYPEREIPILSAATVLVSSEADGSPIANAFDDTRGPGATQWIAGETESKYLSFHFTRGRPFGA